MRVLMTGCDGSAELRFADLPVTDVGGVTVKVAPPTDVAKVPPDTLLTTNNTPPHGWVQEGGRFGDAEPAPPEPIGAPVFVGEAGGDSLVYLFLYEAVDEGGAPLECQVVWEEGIAGLARGGYASGFTCSPRGATGYGVHISGGTMKGWVTWGPLPPGALWAEITVGEDRYRVGVRGGYAFLAGIAVDIDDTILGVARGPEGELLYEGSFEPGE